MCDGDVCGCGVTKCMNFQPAQSWVYDEQQSPEAFYVPYLWTTTVERTPDLLWDASCIALIIPTEAGLSPPTVLVPQASEILVPPPPPTEVGTDEKVAPSSENEV